MRKLILLFSALVLCIGVVFGQGKTVSGRVIDENNEPAIGASIQVKGAETVGTISDFDGNFTITLPAGTTEVSYYAVAWKGNPTKLEFSIAGNVVATQEVAANDGASGQAPYTITVADTDKYTVTLAAALEAETVVTVKTVETGFRAILFGVQAK